MVRNFSIILTLVVACGCAPLPPGVSLPEKRPLYREVPAPLPPETPSGLEAAEVGKGPAGELTLRKSVAFALINNPALRAFSLEVRAAEARALQAGLLPNPEFGLEVEDVAGSGDRAGFKGSETTLQIGQLIELGGKPWKRRNVAQFEAKLSGWDYEAQRLAVITEVTEAFLAVLAAQERVSLLEKTVELAEKVLQAVAKRVAAGRESPLERTKASVALATSRTQLMQERKRLKAARIRLAATWGGKAAAFTRAVGALEQIEPPPERSRILAFIESNPLVARWAAELERRRAQLALEKVKPIPDVTVFGGVRHYNETDGAGFIFGFALPIPIFNRNQGAILAAEFEVAKARYERRNVEARVYAAAVEAYQALSAAYESAEALRKEILPGAREAFEAAQRAYQEGKTDYLGVLDAQRTYFEARARYVGALSAYHSARARLEGLLGRTLSELRKQKKDDL